MLNASDSARTGRCDPTLIPHLAYTFLQWGPGKYKIHKNKLSNKVIYSKSKNVALDKYTCTCMQLYGFNFAENNYRKIYDV